MVRRERARAAVYKIGRISACVCVPFRSANCSVFAWILLTVLRSLSNEPVVSLYAMRHLASIKCLIATLMTIDRWALQALHDKLHHTIGWLQKCYFCLQEGTSYLGFSFSPKVSWSNSDLEFFWIRATARQEWRIYCCKKVQKNCVLRKRASNGRCWLIEQRTVWQATRNKKAQIMIS